MNYFYDISIVSFLFVFPLFLKASVSIDCDLMEKRIKHILQNVSF